MSEEDKKLEEDINMLVQRLQVGVIFFFSEISCKKIKT